MMPPPISPKWARQPEIARQTYEYVNRGLEKATSEPFRLTSMPTPPVEKALSFPVTTCLPLTIKVNMPFAATIFTVLTWVGPLPCLNSFPKCLLQSDFQGSELALLLSYLQNSYWPPEPLSTSKA